MTKTIPQFGSNGCRNRDANEQETAKTVALDRYFSCDERGYPGAAIAAYDIAKRVRKELRKHKNSPEKFAAWAQQFFTLPPRRAWESYEL